MANEIRCLTRHTDTSNNANLTHVHIVCFVNSTEHQTHRSNSSGASRDVSTQKKKKNRKEKMFSFLSAHARSISINFTSFCSVPSLDHSLLDELRLFFAHTNLKVNQSHNMSLYRRSVAFLVR